MEADNEEINIKRQLANVKHSYDELTRSYEAESSLRKKVHTLRVISNIRNPGHLSMLPNCIYTHANNQLYIYTCK